MVRDAIDRLNITEPCALITNTNYAMGLLKTVCSCCPTFFSTSTARYEVRPPVPKVSNKLEDELDKLLNELAREASVLSSM